jgi:hypothetical protein
MAVENHAGVRGKLSKNLGCNISACVVLGAKASILDILLDLLECDIARTRGLSLLLHHLLIDVLALFLLLGNLCLQHVDFSLNVIIFVLILFGLVRCTILLDYSVRCFALDQ